MVSRIGLTKKEAVESILKAGFQPRIISEDSNIYVTLSGCCGNGPEPKNPNRINLRIMGGKVIESFIG